MDLHGLFEVKSTEVSKTLSFSSITTIGIGYIIDRIQSNNFGMY